MLNKYVIYERYETWSSNGKTWTNWFIAPLTEKYNNERPAIERAKELTKEANSFGKSLHLKHEYEARLIDVETLPKPSIKFHKKGRPTKVEVIAAQEAYDNYWQNQSYNTEE